MSGKLGGGNAIGSQDEYTLNTTVAVGGTSINILDSFDRQEYSVVNSSAGGQTIWLFLGFGTAAIGIGIPLAPGQAWVSSDGASFRCFRGRIQAISTAAGGAVAIMAR